MIVDPETGEPIAPSQQAQSAAAMAGQAAIGDPTALSYQLLGHVPGAPTLAAWNMGRGINTVMGGGFNRGRAYGDFSTKAGWKSAAINTFSPTRFTSFSSPTALMADPDGPAYTPFNNMARAGNWMARRGAQRALSNDNGSARAAFRTVLGVDGNDAKKLESAIGDVAAGRTRVFDGGVAARLGVSSRLGDMRAGRDGRLSRRDSKKLAKTLHSMDRMGIDVRDLDGVGDLLDTASRSGWDAARTGRRGVADGTLNVKTARAASMRMMGSFQGRFTQQAAGWMAGMSPGFGAGSKGGPAFQRAYHASRMRMIDGSSKFLGKPVREVLEAGAGKTMGMAFKAAGQKGGKAFAGTLAAKAGLKVGSKFIPVAGQVLLAADIMGAALDVTKAAAQFGLDASKSIQGQIQKPIFGMGYKDNEINATSRARGLTAIQDSRLNARNALGHEAGMMAGHFG